MRPQLSPGPSDTWKGHAVSLVPYLGTALAGEQSSGTGARRKELVAASGSSPSFTVCRSQLTGMKQTGLLHASAEWADWTACPFKTHMPPEVNSQSSHTLLFVKAGTVKDFFLGIRNSTSSNALESSDNDRDLLKKAWDTLEIKPTLSLKAAAVYSKPVKQRSRSH